MTARPGDKTRVDGRALAGSGAGGKKPILILAHMDVVEAKRADWKEDPFQFIEKDGYFYGRGTSDDKQGVIATTAALIKLRAAGFKPTRDIILFFTGDEETEGNGARLGATEWRNLLDAEYALNADAGGGAFTRDGRPLGFGLQTAEKIFQSYHFTASNKGGHSSRPRPDNAIYELSAALDAAFDASLRADAERDHPRLFHRAGQAGDGCARRMRCAPGSPIRTTARPPTRSRPMSWRPAMTRTRCVATMLEGGHAHNALPQMAGRRSIAGSCPGSIPRPSRPS